jgi:hypothetical protein
MISRIPSSFLLFIAVLFLQKAVGQINQAVTPESQNISTERLNRIDAQIK